MDVLPFACHKLTKSVAKDEGGNTLARVYEVENNEKCAFVAKPLPAKNAATKNDAGSILCCGGAGAKWNWETGLHTDGLLTLNHHLKYDASAQQKGVVPQQIAVYVVEPLRIHKEKLYKIA